jgi:pimeloyl-ACP methyl ester carboxylesterase/lysophospholipase L1-like esterase
MRYRNGNIIAAKVAERHQLPPFGLREKLASVGCSLISRSENDYNNRSAVPIFHFCNERTMHELFIRIEKHAGLIAVACIVACFVHSSARAADEPVAVKHSTWNDFERLDFVVDGRACLLVVPKTAAPGRPWIWRTEFFGHEPQADLALLARGFHVAYIDVQNMYGAPAALDHMDRFYEYLIREYKLSPKTVLEGFSRGGLFSLNWGARNPGKTACIYNDAPVCDFKSWPGGFGKAQGSPDDWKRCLAVYKLTEQEAKEYRLNPVDNLAPLAKAKVPLLHVCGAADEVVPMEENTRLVETRYRELGGEIIVIAKPGIGHHPHSLQNPFPIVAFVLEHTGVALPPADLLKESKRIVFLGDSITAAGIYVGEFDAWLAAKKEGVAQHVIDAGLPSETVSGLSEEGHAGGQFPRPDLAERLERVLALTKPDLVFACYGINCGIYEPFDNGRFERYQQGIRRLKRAVEERGARLVVITPPFYDDQTAPKSFSYNGVIDRYSDWLLECRKEGWQVVDLHGPMTQEVAKRRAADPKFTFQPDGVHPNEAGQWFVARQLIRWFGDEKAAAAGDAAEMLKSLGAPVELLPLIQQRVNLLRDAYVGTAGHKRPGVAQGLPVTEAEKQAEELSARIEKLLATEK